MIMSGTPESYEANQRILHKSMELATRLYNTDGIEQLLPGKSQTNPIGATVLRGEAVQINRTLLKDDANPGRYIAVQGAQPYMSEGGISLGYVINFAELSETDRPIHSVTVPEFGGDLFSGLDVLRVWLYERGDDHLWATEATEYNNHRNAFDRRPADAQALLDALSSIEEPVPVSTKEFAIARDAHIESLATDQEIVEGYLVGLLRRISPVERGFADPELREYRESEAALHIRNLLNGLNTLDRSMVVGHCIEIARESNRKALIRRMQGEQETPDEAFEEASRLLEIPLEDN
jgi:hypothetical protein